jgi:hypothetical protein
VLDRDLLGDVHPVLRAVEASLPSAIDLDLAGVLREVS